MDSEQSTISYRITMKNIYSFTHQLIYSGIYPPRSESFTISCKTNPISTISLGKSGVIYAKNITKYYEKLQNNTKMPAFCTFLLMTHLTPYTTKTYITFPLKISRIENQESSIENMQNEPNFPDAKMNLSAVVLISRPWRIPQNNQPVPKVSSIINLCPRYNQWKGGPNGPQVTGGVYPPSVWRESRQKCKTNPI